MGKGGTELKNVFPEKPFPDKVWIYENGDTDSVFCGEHICPACKKRWNLTFRRMGRLYENKYFDMKCSRCGEKFTVWWTGKHVGYDIKYAPENAKEKNSEPTVRDVWESLSDDEQEKVAKEITDSILASHRAYVSNDILYRNLLRMALKYCYVMGIDYEKDDENGNSKVILKVHNKKFRRKRSSEH